MKLLISILVLLSCNSSFAQSGELRGQVLENSTKKTIPFSKIKIYKNNSLLTEIDADSLGYYGIENLIPDTFTVTCEAENYERGIAKVVFIRNAEITYVPFLLKKK